MEIPECISIQRYRALIHKRIPIHSVGIEILPAYYQGFLKKEYPDDYFSLPAAFQSIDQASDFPAMSKLLFEIENYHGDGMAAALFYEAKVTEAIALVVDAWKRQSQKQIRPLSTGDLAGLNNVVSYIAEYLLINTDFTMGQIAQMIGYTTSSRFAELFRKSTGILPIEYRKIARGH